MLKFLHQKKGSAPPPSPSKQEKEILEFSAQESSSAPRILVYGIEQVGLDRPTNPIRKREFELEFGSFHSSNKFYDYDGVILFQSTFESVEHLRNVYFSAGFRLKYDRDELVKRRTQSDQLLEKGGFLCFLVHREFITHDGTGNNLTETDLCKIYSNFHSLFRKSLEGDHRVTKVYRGEFEPFLKDYGIARTQFDYYNDWLEANTKKICTTGYNNVVGFILLNKIYFVPCRLPSKDETGDFFTKLASALMATSKKLSQEIPAWVEEYVFPKEGSIKQEKQELLAELERLNNAEEIYQGYKRCLCYSGELLVESVAEVLTQGLGLQLGKEKDVGIEDKTIVDSQGNDLVLVEIKGTNGNVTNQDIYQADSHRGRRSKAEDFPSILIMNTLIKGANSLNQKLQDVGAEQVKLAVKKDVLIVRTIDLLNLLNMKEQVKIDAAQVLRLFREERGWLKVSTDSFEVVHVEAKSPIAS